MAATAKIPDWLGYIRPHMRPYEALGRGARGDYIAKLARKTKLSDNSLRRFIAAAQFLESEGITALAPGTRLPIGAVERIARIAALEPARRGELLNDVLAGRITVERLALELERSKKAAAKRSRTRPSEVSLDELALAELEARGIGKREQMIVVAFEATPHWEYFDSQARPAFVVMLPLPVGGIPVMDERSVARGSSVSFMRQRKEFLRNILVATNLCTFVAVYASGWRHDVEKLVGDMRPDCRSRIILIGPPGGAQDAAAALQ
jgi:hypothetical protein